MSTQALLHTQVLDQILYTLLEFRPDGEYRDLAMDPLSIIASSLAISGALISSLKAFNSIKNAPVEAREVLKDLEDLHNVFTQIEEVYLNRQLHGGLTQVTQVAFESVLVSAREELEKINWTTRQQITNGNSNSRLIKFSSDHLASEGIVYQNSMY